MEVLYYIIAIGLILLGFVTFITEARENGVFVIFEIIGIVILFSLGL